MRIKWIFLSILIFVVGGLALMFFAYPRGLSLMFSYKKECRVARVEPFMKGLVVSNMGQVNKYAIICDDGFVCRAEDTGFASVKESDLVEFRGFPEFSTFEELGKCDHAQLIRVKQQAATGHDPTSATDTISPRNQQIPAQPVQPTQPVQPGQ